jgi:hypothetical protein
VAVFLSNLFQNLLWPEDFFILKSYDIDPSTAMASASPDPLTEERLAQLESVLSAHSIACRSSLISRDRAISKTRNALLREMYYMMKRRNNIGSVFTLDDEEEEEDEDLHVFLARHDLHKKCVSFYFGLTLG